MKSLNRLTDRGFGHIELVLGITIIALFAFVGYRVLTQSHAATVTANILWSYTTYDQATNTRTSYVKQADSSNTITDLLTPAKRYWRDGLSYSPDHQKIAYLSNGPTFTEGRVVVLGVATKSTTTIAMPTGITGDTGNDGVPAGWFPGGNKLAFIGQKYTTSGTQYHLYTVSADGTGLTHVRNVTSLGLPHELSITGNGRYIVLSSDSGVYAIVPGATAPIALGQSCISGVSRPGTKQGVAMVCNSYGTTADVSSIQYKTIGSSSSATLITSTGENTNGNISMEFGDIAWSPDGTKLGINYDTRDYEGECNITATPQIGTLPAQGGSVATVWTGTAQTGTGCQGQGSVMGKTIAWNQDGSSIGYIWGYGSLYKSTVPAASTPKLLSTQAREVAW